MVKLDKDGPEVGERRFEVQEVVEEEVDTTTEAI